MYLSWKSNKLKKNSHYVSKHYFIPLMKNQYNRERWSWKKQNGSVAEVGIRGAFIVNLIKRKLLSSALSRLGGWVGVLSCCSAGGVPQTRLSGWGNKMKKCFETAWRQRMGRHWRHGGAILQLLSFSIHFHLHTTSETGEMEFIWFTPPLPLCDERSLCCYVK